MASDPLVLAFDTSAAQCAVALVLGPKILDVRIEAMHKGQAERLFPLLQEVLERAQKSWSDLTAIGVGTGPGNFTGIRLSVSAARGLALSLGIPAVGVSTFDALAEGLDRPVLAYVDARRGQAYVQLLNEPLAAITALTDDGTLPPKMRNAKAVNVGAVDAFDLGKHAIVQPPTCPLPVAIAKITLRRHLDTHDRPAPLYIRTADAAPSREPPPVILV